MGDLLVDGAPGAGRRLAGPAAARRPPPAARRRRAAGSRLDLLHDQPDPEVHPADELEPFPGPGVGAVSPPPVPGAGEPAAPRDLALSSAGTTRQISVSGSKYSSRKARGRPIIHSRSGSSHGPRVTTTKSMPSHSRRRRQRT